MAKQMLIDAIRGKRTPRAPWVPYAGVHCAFVIGEPADKFLKDPQLLAKGVVETARKYKADGIPLVFDLSVESESMGLEIKYWKDNVPSVQSHPLSDKTVEEAGLKVPGPNDGRWPVLFEAARIAKPQLDELDCALMGLACGPLTLASHLAGVRIFTDVVKNKEKAHHVLKFCAQVVKKSVEMYCDMDCDIIAIVDPVASQIRNETFKEFVHPYCQDAIAVIHERGKTSSFFICGDATKVLESVCQIGTHGFAIDEQLNLTFVRDLARKYGVGFGGNLKLTLAMSLGIVSPREDAIVSLAAGGTHGYVFAPG
ncbi:MULTISPECIES: uroporphyrinogen decarboxylase family protein [Desulfofundulus]|uniref:Methyltransferase, MtaA/CmuA family n=2 Tax=Desulfofundulus TaxID=2282741 RepID=A0A1M6HVJ7_9FIRM|nr:MULTISPECIES: uroporphyrinogen decarboxylase family protein [Desulfofundulus]MDQ0285231.1 uroporphyrinogen decarboxylase [Desulfofundulus luciae]SHJ26246.1 methyltransferase, MtaA/CmuA family [Desulfofundulus thermosubterraneus DSM 16057]